MSNFQRIVMTVAIVILIICLIAIGIAMYNSKYSKVYPPVVADCPDYWLDLGDVGGADCVNVKNLGSDNCNKTMNFTTDVWTGDDGLCYKSKWAKACDLTWDGVTNNTNACADVTDTTS
jgi:type IV secretory pathway TrbF-like protein|tara:strand:- start:604 stop:960 length:357 start_codon:yes stop_codon:yes gene_type:complete